MYLQILSWIQAETPRKVPAPARLLSLFLCCGILHNLTVQNQYCKDDLQIIRYGPCTSFAILEHRLIICNDRDIAHRYACCIGDQRIKILVYFRLYRFLFAATYSSKVMSPRFRKHAVYPHHRSHSSLRLQIWMSRHN